jgi:hypothetical protein
MKKPTGNILESKTQRRNKTHVASTVGDPEKKHEGYELYMEIKVVRNSPRNWYSYPPCRTNAQ